MSSKNKWIKLLQRWAGSTVFVIGLIIVLRTFVLDWSVVPSGSMTHTFLTGDVVLNNKLAYQYDWASVPIIGVYFAKKRMIDIPNLKRGDIIVFCGKDTYITKRVVGLPGDTVSWDHIDLKINGESTMFNPDGSRIYPETKTYTLHKNHHDLNIDEVMDEYYSRIPVGDGSYRKITTVHSRKQDVLPMVDYKVPPGHVFIVGDNRFPQYSWDSRDSHFGDVCMSMITGRVDYRLFGSNAKVFNKQRSWFGTIVMLPYLGLRYLLSIDLLRFGKANSNYVYKMEGSSHPNMVQNKPEYKNTPDEDDRSTTASDISDMSDLDSDDDILTNDNNK